jgi:membrane protein implicated in regulation of membrane protease activity
VTQNIETAVSGHEMVRNRLCGQRGQGTVAVEEVAERQMDFSSPEVWRWIWMVLAVVFVVGEIAVAGSFFLLPFGVGAAAAALVSFLGAPTAVGWAAFVAISAASSAVLWPLGRRLDRRSPHSPTGANRWVGREAYVLKDIPAGTGQTGLIRLDREEWRAESLTGASIRAGSTVHVSRIDGTRLVVIPIDEPFDELPPTTSDPAREPGSSE